MTLITGGNSGIGRAVAYAFVKEEAKVVIAYYDEDRDAQGTAGHIRKMGSGCLLLRGDLKDPAFAKQCVEQIVERFGALDILVNNHAVQSIQRSILDISREQLSQVFQNNIYSFSHLIQETFPHLKAGASIINTTSVTACQEHKDPIDYSATKRVIVALSDYQAVARLELTPSMPTLARIEVSAANTADNTAKMNHIITTPMRIPAHSVARWKALDNLGLWIGYFQITLFAARRD